MNNEQTEVYEFFLTLFSQRRRKKHVANEKQNFEFEIVFCSETINIFLHTTFMTFII